MIKNRRLSAGGVIGRLQIRGGPFNFVRSNTLFTSPHNRFDDSKIEETPLDVLFYCRLQYFEVKLLRSSAIGFHTSEDKQSGIVEENALNHRRTPTEASKE
jgi:hypothetical protein